MNSSRSVIPTFWGRVYRGFNKLLKDVKLLLVRTSTILTTHKHEAVAVAATFAIIRVVRVASTFSKFTGTDLLLCTLAVLYDIASLYFFIYVLDETCEHLKT